MREWKQSAYDKVLPEIGMPEDHSALTDAVLEALGNRSDGESNDEVAYKAALLAERKFKEERKRMREEIQAEQRLTETPGDRILADAILRALKPVVEDLRQERFGSSESPFQTIEETAAWIEEESSADWERFCQEDNLKWAALKESQRLQYEYLLEEVKVSDVMLPYHDSAEQSPGEGHVKKARTAPDTYLRGLWRETDRIARHTGFPQDAFVMHVLMGGTPKRSRARLTKRRNYYTVPGSGEQIVTTSASVHIFARDLSDKELRLLIAAIHGHIGGKGSEPLSDEEEVLWKAVKDLGGVPTAHGSKVLFWEAVGKRLEEEPVYRSSTTPGAVGKRYDRILKRLSALR